MTEETRSPRRRHILSSINPESDDPKPHRKRPRRHSRSPTPTRTDRDRDRQREDADDGDTNEPEDTTRPRRSRLKLKDHKSSRRRKRSRSPRDESPSGSHRSRHHRSRRHRPRHRRTPSPDPYEPPPLSPNAAFRESLFDALADEEGADYWEAVYGQPVHVYPPEEKENPQGELERMSEEEYATYVRQRMWEKTHAGLLEEREKRKEAQKKKEEEKARHKRWEKDVEESLKRGEERRERRRWHDKWEAYEEAWHKWDGKPSTLAWPTESGNGTDVEEKAVRAFFIHGLKLKEVGETAFAARLREERVRWHPDKIQQRTGGQADEATMRNVTATFQIIDRLWGETRAKQ